MSIDQLSMKLTIEAILNEKDNENQEVANPEELEMLMGDAAENNNEQCELDIETLTNDLTVLANQHVTDEEKTPPRVFNGQSTIQNGGTLVGNQIEESAINSNLSYTIPSPMQINQT